MGLLKARGDFGNVTGSVSYRLTDHRGYSISYFIYMCIIGARNVFESVFKIKYLIIYYSDRLTTATPTTTPG